jgi:hypothetical protein
VRQGLTALHFIQEKIEAQEACELPRVGQCDLASKRQSLVLEPSPLSHKYYVHLSVPPLLSPSNNELVHLMKRSAHRGILKLIPKTQVHSHLTSPAKRLLLKIFKVLPQRLIFMETFSQQKAKPFFLNLSSPLNLFL